MILSTLAAALLLTSEVPPAEATATIPLDHLIELRRAQEKPRITPPVSAVVTRSSLEGRLTEEALTVEAQFDVEVLDSEEWTRVELLELGADTWIVETSSLSGATVAAVEGRLVLLSNQAGRYSFTVRVNVRAAGSRSERKAQLRLGKDVAPVPLRLDVDGAVFAVKEREVAPSGRLLNVAWKEVAPTVEKQELVRAPLEPRIPEATAIWVTTLEGNLTLRMSYVIRLDRAQTIAFDLPPHHTLARAVINGMPIQAKSDATRVELEIAPARLGETQATIELVLSRQLGTFHLSGQLGLELPRVSWPVDTLRAHAHLPAVFNYQRTGGSLELASEDAPASGDSGLPGKELRFHQMLVGGTAPSLELAYSVDISKSYFRSPAGYPQY